MQERGAAGRATLSIVAAALICGWILAGFHAYASYTDAHNPGLVHVRATLTRCGPYGCEGSFQLDGRHYVVTQVNGSDGQQVVLYVKRSDPYSYAQAQDRLHAYGPLALVVALTIATSVVGLLLRRRRRAQTSPAERRS